MNATRNTLIFVYAVAAACGMANVKADFTFGEPVMFGSGLGSGERIDCLSYDGLEMYIASARSGGQGGLDLWVLKRVSNDDNWGPPQNLGPAVNSPNYDLLSSISADGLTLYFCSDRRYGDDNRYDIFVSTRATRSDPWGPAVNAGPAINGLGGLNFGGAWISPDNRELYICSLGSRPGGYGAKDMWVAKRATTSDPWAEPVNLGPVVNTQYGDTLCSLSPDGLLLLFSPNWNSAPLRPNGYGGPDLWIARRASMSDPWQAPVNLGPRVNGPATDIQPRISPDGRTLYFLSNRDGDWQAWEAPISADYDFNGDGETDEKDILVMTQYWGQDYPPCDIGPFPWGDGVVDAQDWMVLMEVTEGPGFVLSPKRHAAEVPRDVVLSWAAPKFAKAQDVYFGASFEDVHSASRNDPRGVLISKAQTANTYDPEGLLEFNRTYYWRVDFVVPGPTPTIYRGPVLDFTTEAFAYPIKNVTAAASSAQPGSGPERTVDGSGLDTTDGHSTDQKDMWWSLAEPSHWIQYEFDRVYTLHEMWVWNMNQIIEPFIGFGAKTVKIEYSTDGSAWTSLANVPEFAQAPGQSGYLHDTTITFGGAPAKFVKLTIEKNWGVAPQTGLSEVRFFCIQTAGASKP